MKDSARAVHGGNLKGAETLLVSQAVALNAIFNELARRCALNMGEHLDATDRYMRLALKAQGQCRATLETLATIKNPPVVFAKQANINNGGQQQVNNGAAAVLESARAQAHAQAGNPSTQQTELLEQQHGQRLDTGAMSVASGADPHLAPMGAINRAENR